MPNKKSRHPWGEDNGPQKKILTNSRDSL